MPKPKKRPTESCRELDFYSLVVAGTPGAILKGATVPYTSVNGNMFSYLSKNGVLALRLPDEQREAFLKKYKTTLCTQYGVVQKEYVEVPPELLENTKELQPFFALSLSYATSLKAKPTTRAKR